WIDNVPVRCEACEQPVERIAEVGDVWLDAGIVPFSTLGWQNPEWKPGGYATGASKGLSGADLPDHAYWEKWFPADWVSEMGEEIKRKLLTLWHSVSFLVTYANIEGFQPRYADLESGPDGELRPLDRWLVARTQQLVAEATAEYEETLTFRVIRAFETFVEDV